MENYIAIHGLGYVGLTAAVHWARAGWRVVAYDPDLPTVDALRRGEPRAGEFLSYLDDEVAQLVEKDLIFPTSDLAVALECPVQLVAVPTERDGKPYDDIVLGVLEKLLLDSPMDSTILVESTLTPGTLDRFFYTEKGEVKRPGLLGSHYLAVCPRRDWFADTEKNLATLPRIVGGLTPECTDKAAALLSIVSSKIHRTDYRTAELTKALENAWLHALVMLPTELALSRPDLNVAEATRLASTHWRLPSIFLSAGCGGRCVPLGTKYLRGLSDAQPSVLGAVDATEEKIRKACAYAFAQRNTKDVLVLGAAYRPNFRDMGSSPGLAVARTLVDRYGISVSVHDPMWQPDELESLTGLPCARRDPRPQYDAIFLATPHSAYESVPPLEGVRFILDAAGIWAKHGDHFRTLGIEYKRVGSPGWLRG